MNLEVVSNTPNRVGGENFNNTFVMPLPEIIDAENEKKIIRVLNVSYPLTIENVSGNKCGIRVHFHFRLFRDIGSIPIGYVHPEVLRLRKKYHNIIRGYNDDTMTLIKYMIITYIMLVNKHGNGVVA